MAGDSARLPESQAPRALAESVPDLGEGVAAWAVECAGEVYATLTEEVPAGGQSSLVGDEQAAIEASVYGLLGALGLGRSFAVPAEAIHQVRAAARKGVPLDAFLRIVWAAHSQIQDRLFAEVSSRLPADLAVVELGSLAKELLEVASVLVDGLAHAFQEEDRAWRQHRNVRVRQAMDHLLATGSADPSAEAVLGVRFTSHHVGVVLRPDDVGATPMWGEKATTWTRRVGEILGSGACLVVPRADGSCEVVFSCSSAPSATSMSSAARLALPPGYAGGIGPAAFGISGFRETMLWARDLARSATPAKQRRPWSVTEDGLAALLIADPEAAGRFARHHLKGLTGLGARDRALRETMASFLRHHGSRNASAAELHVAPTTVAYRVHRARELLEDPVDGRTAELLAALTIAQAHPDLLA